MDTNTRDDDATHPWFSQHRMMLEVDFNRPTARGHLSISAWIVPATEPVARTTIHSPEKRKLMEVTFVNGPDDEHGNMTFYNPDGSVYGQYGMAPDDPEPDDTVLNGDLNLAWTGDASAPLLQRTGMRVVQTAQTVLLAHEIAKHSDGKIKAKAAFDSLMSDTPGVVGQFLYTHDELANPASVQ